MNFPCQTDLDFYQSKRTPRWSARIRRHPYSESRTSWVDRLVEAHAKVRPTSGELTAHNLLSILRSQRRRGEDLEASLRTIAEHPECMIDPKKRAAFARKWAERMTRP